MSEDRITVDELRYLSVFQNFTEAVAYRCIIDEEGNRLIFLVNKGDLGKAIGKAGKNVKMLSKIFNKSIEIVEYSDDIDGMVKNLFSGVKILGIDVVTRGGEKQVIVKVAEEDKGKAIGREGRNIKRARLVLSKLFNVSKIIIR
ncbi:MAG: NusA-like transcription termination signal-binding factor [Desulfurococcales archaeon]|nr:NusA-like transcription termination signal-binding factor [Desulfurococcales archaeon]MEB3779825.1 NusA-like transcription termination signal-binding factor [Desulfurococcales archaeon]